MVLGLLDAFMLEGVQQARRPPPSSLLGVIPAAWNRQLGRVIVFFTSLQCVTLTGTPVADHMRENVPTRKGERSLLGMVLWKQGPGDLGSHPNCPLFTLNGRQSPP